MATIYRKRRSYAKWVVLSYLILGMVGFYTLREMITTREMVESTVVLERRTVAEKEAWIGYWQRRAWNETQRAREAEGQLEKLRIRQKADAAWWITYGKRTVVVE